MGVSKKERKEARLEKLKERYNAEGTGLGRAVQFYCSVREWASLQRLLYWVADTRIGAFLVRLVQRLAVALFTLAHMARENFAALQGRWQAGSRAQKKAKQQAREARRETSMGSSPAVGRSRVSSSGGSKTAPNKAVSPAGHRQQLDRLRRLSSGASDSRRSEELEAGPHQRQNQGGDSEAVGEPDMAAAGYAGEHASSSGVEGEARGRGTQPGSNRSLGSAAAQPAMHPGAAQPAMHPAAAQRAMHPGGTLAAVRASQQQPVHLGVRHAAGRRRNSVQQVQRQNLQGAVGLTASLQRPSRELAGHEQQPQELPTPVQQQGMSPYLRVVSQQEGRAGQEQPPRQQQQQHVLTASPGMSNEIGEYSCFLNTIVQCLFSCPDFRSKVAAWPPFLRDYNAVLRAVHSVFSSLEAKIERAAGQHDAYNVVNANALQEALSAMPGQLFKTGEMNDASEVLLTLYDQINQGVAAGLAFSFTLDVDLNALVGLDVREYVYCPACQLITHSTRYIQYIYNTQATGIRDVRGHGDGHSLGHLLRLLAEETRKSCDPDKGGCNTRLPPVHSLDSSRAPCIFTLQLEWESQREKASDIAATLDAITEGVDLAEVYSGLPPRKHLYRLRSLVCYCGAHYFAYVLRPELQAWAKIDDAHVSRVGSWADVKRKCVAGRVQPTVLFFEALQ